jgi:hypothetical protein
METWEGYERPQAGCIYHDLTKAKPCVEANVRMLIGKSFKETSALFSDRRVWEIDDVLEYLPTSARLPVEFGKLVPARLKPAIASRTLPELG